MFMRRHYFAATSAGRCGQFLAALVFGAAVLSGVVTAGHRHTHNFANVPQQQKPPASPSKPPSAPAAQNGPPQHPKPPGFNPPNNPSQHKHNAGPALAMPKHPMLQSHQFKPSQHLPPPKPTQQAQPKPAQKRPQAVPPITLPIMAAPSLPTFAPAATPAAASETWAPTIAAATNDADTPMKVGVLQQEEESFAKPQVKSLVQKASAKASKTSDPNAPPEISIGVGMPPQTGTYRRNEILAGKLSPAAKARVIGLGYDLSENSTSGLSRIYLPPLREAWEIAHGLEQEFPNQGFALNYIYEPYRYVLGEAPIEASVPVSPSVGCSTERCYGRRAIGWQDHLAACAKGVKVGVIDTGFDASHPTFAKRSVMPTVVMRAEDPAARAPNWHGTGVLSLLAGAATSSTPGLIPDADFLVADAFFAGAAGQPQTDTVHLLEALQRLAKNGAQIINMSLVGPSDDLLHDRIAHLSKHRGIIFIAAAGNGGQRAPPGYPAAYREVIAVTAVDSSGRSYRDANHGRYINVAAPGVHIWTALPDNKEGMLSGTSFAVPFVTAITAVTYNRSRLKAMLATKHRELDPKEMTLAGFSVDKVEGGDSRQQRETFGQGLVKAPTDCAPKPQPWAAKVLPGLTAPAAWLTNVKPASFQ